MIVGISLPFPSYTVVSKEKLAKNATIAYNLSIQLFSDTGDCNID